MSLTSLKSKKDLTEVFAAAPNSAWKIPDTISRVCVCTAGARSRVALEKCKTRGKVLGADGCGPPIREEDHMQTVREKKPYLYLMALFSEEPLSKWAPPTTFTSEGAPLCHRD